MQKCTTGFLFCFCACFVFFGSDAACELVKNIEVVETGLIELAAPTYTSGNPKPDLSYLKRDNEVLARSNTVFIAKIETFDLSYYFTFEAQEDVDRLVGEIMQRYTGWRISWYYLPDADKYDLRGVEARKDVDREIEAIVPEVSRGSLESVQLVPLNLPVIIAALLATVQWKTAACSSPTA